MKRGFHNTLLLPVESGIRTAGRAWPVTPELFEIDLFPGGHSGILSQPFGAGSMSVIGIFHQLVFLPWLAYTRRVERAPDQPHSKFKHVYPIVRIDMPFNKTDPTNTVMVVTVLTSQTDAEKEVSRLNQINADNSCVYFYCTSRLIEQNADAPKLV
jgi:hypothetical protein